MGALRFSGGGTSAATPGGRGRWPAHHGASCLTAIQVVLNRDLGLQERPEALNRSPSELHAILADPAAVSDLLPIAAGGCRT